ncbi:uncharacterized protein ZBIST_0613 [Zygosaccharomyces bailii]|nr:uncharacterized protein ZBAI_07624 [Zygosaccharomyces bailii ISA1307]SJM82701.1 uncharacterized protein ZBIST_0613 [Zygosaccharomyces bailii]
MNRNPLYPLYVKEFPKGLSIHRVADDARIATVVVRDMSQVAGYQWDKATGKFISVFYKDGTARVYDGFRSGRLVSLLRVGDGPVEAGVWDRIQLAQDAAVIDHDVTQQMPRMIKFARDSHRLCVVPYSLPSGVWRTENVLDVHVLLGESWMVMLDGELPLSIPIHADVQSPLIKLVTAQHKGFAFYSDGTVKTLDVNALLEHPPTLRLLKTVMAMEQLHRYLLDHSELVLRDLIQPYEDFVERTCDGAFGYVPLQEQLTELLLIGSVSSGLEDWLVNSIGDKNLRRWRKLGTEAYHKTLQVLTLAFLPVCERLIVLSQRLRGILASMNLPCPTQQPLQELLHAVLEAIARLSAQQRLLGSFLDWLEDKVHGSLDEDYKPHNFRTATRSISKYLQLRLQFPSSEFESINMEELLTASKGHMQETSAILHKELAVKITTQTQSLVPLPDTPLLDVIALENTILLACPSQTLLLDTSLRTLSQHSQAEGATSAHWSNNTLHASFPDGTVTITSYQVTPNGDLQIASTPSRAMS